MQIKQNIPSRIVLVRRDISGERTFGGFIGHQGKGFADQFLLLSDLQKIWPELIKDANCLVLGTIPLASSVSRETVLWVIDQAKKEKLDIAIDVNWRPTFWESHLSPDSPPTKEISSLIISFLEKASLIKLAKEEAIYFFNSNDPFEISATFTHKPNVVITDGSNPIRWYLDGLKGTFDSLSPVQVVDTTGAGDSFMSGLIAKTALTASIKKDHSGLLEIVRFAAACGALVCSGTGAIDPHPTYAEVEAFLSEDVGN